MVEYFKSAEKLGVDWRKLFEVAKLGSGNSGALNRIAEKAIGGDYKGYTFSVSNTVKDLSYINDLVKIPLSFHHISGLTNLTGSFGS